MMLKSREELAAYRKSCEAALSNQSIRVLVCAGTGCVAGGSLEIYKRLIELCEEMKLDVTFLGGNEWASDEFAEKAGEYADSSNVAFVSYLDPSIEEDTQEVGKETQKFLDAFYAKYGKGAVPNENMMLGYDAYLVAIKAAAEAGDNLDGENIRKVLDGDITFEGASGNIRFNDVGDPIKTVYITTVSDNGNSLIYTINPAN